MQTAPKGAALWTPAPRRGASYADGTKGRCPLDFRWGFTPDPEMLTHLCFACGRDGGMGALLAARAVLTCLPKGGQTGRWAVLTDVRPGRKNDRSPARFIWQRFIECMR